MIWRLREDLSICAWAYAKLQYEDKRPLLAAIATEALRQLPGFTGRNLANLAMLGRRKSPRAPCRADVRSSRVAAESEAL